MTYPSVPLGQQFHHKRLADDLLDIAPRLSMHNAVDVPLNAGALLLRNMSARPHVRVVLTNTATITAGSTVLFNVEREDTAGEYNPATGIFTASRSGLYIHTVRLQSSGVTAGRSWTTLVGLDPAIYPASSVIGGVMQASNFEWSDIMAFPVICSAGDQLHVAVGNADLTPRAVAGFDNCYWDIQYIGATPGELAGQRWLDPYVGNSWVDGEQVHDLKLSRRFTEPMNEVQPYLANFGQQFGMLLASTFSTSTAATAKVPWTIDYMTPDFDLSGTDGSTFFNIPRRTPDSSGGSTPHTESLWLVSCALGSLTNLQQAQFTIPELDGFSDLQLVPAGGLNGAGASLCRIGRFGGSQVSVHPYGAFDALGSYRSWLAIVQLGG